MIAPLQSDVHHRRLVVVDKERLLERQISGGRHLNDVRAGHEDAPVLAQLGRFGSEIAVLDADAGARDGIAVGIPHDALNSSVSLANVPEHGQLVVFPKFRQRVAGRIFAATQLQRQLHHAVPDVVEILHSAGQVVPSGSIGRPVGKIGIARIAGAGVAHLSVVESVRCGEMFESVVVRSQARLVSSEVGQDSRIGFVVKRIGGLLKGKQNFVEKKYIKNC